MSRPPVGDGTAIRLAVTDEEIVGVVSSSLGLTASLFVMVACIVYVFGVAIYARKE